MQKEMILTLASLTLIALASISVSAQQMPEPCRHPVEYANKNQVNPSPLSISLISGQVIAEVGLPDHTVREIGPVTEACLGLFTEKGHKLVASTGVDADGRFTFSDIPPGKYRLVVRADPLCVANVPLVLVSGKRQDKKPKQVVIHMRPAGYDTCSYGDYK
jgi:hypothetical protein